MATTNENTKLMLFKLRNKMLTNSIVGLLTIIAMSILANTLGEDLVSIVLLTVLTPVFIGTTASTYFIAKEIIEQHNDTTEN